MTFEEDAGAYDQRDAEGFIRLNALRLHAGPAIGALGGRALRYAACGGYSG